MNRVRVLVVLVVAIVAGGGLAYGTYTYLQNIPVKTVSAPTQPVVVADSNLSLGAELRSSDLRVIDWPAGGVPDGAFDDTSQVVGRGVIAAMVRHEPILDAKLAPRDAGAGLPPVIPAGLRAVSVRVNEVIGVAGYVLPGTRGGRGRDDQSKRSSRDHNVQADTGQRRSAGVRHPNRPGHRPRRPDSGHGRHAAGHAAAGRETGPREHGGEDSACATQPGGSRYAHHAGDAPGYSACRGTAGPPDGAEAETAGRACATASPPTVEVIKGDKREQFIVEG